MVVIVGAYFRYNRAGRLMHKIPGPPKVPLFGHMVTTYKNPDSIFAHLRIWHKIYGRLWRLDGVHIRTVHLYHPEDVELILSTTTFNQKDLPYTFLQGWLGEGLLVSNGDKWHQRRKMLTPAFHFRILNKYFSVLCEHTQDLIVTIENEIDKGKVDLLPLILKATLLIMCETALGAKPHEIPTIKSYIESIHKIDLHNFTKNIIQRRRRNRNKAIELQENIQEEVKATMLDILLDEEAKGNINDKGIQEEVDTFLFEGHDTTATALTFMMMRIANEPDIQDSIYEELQDIFGDSQRPPTVEDLTKMKYLECCIKESMRLYPSVPFLSRHLTKEVVIAGYTIPKNSFVDIHVFDIHRNPEVYPEPEKFRPERFLPENTVERNPYSYIPFSAGPRNCIGQKFAIMMMKTLMSGIMRKYRLEPITRPEDLVFIADLVLRTNHPIYVRFRPRESVTKNTRKQIMTVNF
ncbi:hypothetical protein PYW08_002372 [Mythimna loreyi]|uniref:Uncharacterized protein n=1 Tax=Mythimna loreyi TaxID=667449 RepID=A0ACC2R2T8_9NEOP|nr:hypothetical protein PYW08_002372 [Mythimna loreyi]